LLQRRIHEKILLVVIFYCCAALARARLAHYGSVPPAAGEKPK